MKIHQELLFISIFIIINLTFNAACDNIIYIKCRHCETLLDRCAQHQKSPYNRCSKRYIGPQDKCKVWACGDYSHLQCIQPKTTTTKKVIPSTTNIRSTASLTTIVPNFYTNEKTIRSRIYTYTIKTPLRHPVVQTNQFLTTNTENILPFLALISTQLAQRSTRTSTSTTTTSTTTTENVPNDKKLMSMVICINKRYDILHYK